MHLPNVQMNKTGDREKPNATETSKCTACVRCWWFGRTFMTSNERVTHLSASIPSLFRITSTNRRHTKFSRATEPFDHFHKIERHFCSLSANKVFIFRFDSNERLWLACGSNFINSNIDNFISKVFPLTFLRCDRLSIFVFTFHITTGQTNRNDETMTDQRWLVTF